MENRSNQRVKKSRLMKFNKYYKSVEIPTNDNKQNKDAEMTRVGTSLQ